MQNLIKKSVKISNWIFWLLPALSVVIFSVGRLFVPDYYHYSPSEQLMSALFSGPFLAFVYIVGFIIIFPHWILLIVALFFIRKYAKDKQSFRYLIVASNVLFIVLFFVLNSLCNLSYRCYSEGPLTSGGGVLAYFLVAEWFCTYPFIVFVNKIFDILQKKKHKG